MAAAKISGGAKLEALLDEIAKNVAKPATLRVGFLENATYPDGTFVAMIAAIQNFGAPKVGIPARPFFSDMVREKSPSWAPSLAEALKKWKSTEAAMTVLGETIRGQLQYKITVYVGTPLAPATVARKGFSKQLIDTKKMLDAVDYEIK